MADPSTSPSRVIDDFIARWSPSGGAERANYVMFLTELCDQLGLERPQPADSSSASTYRFEYPVTFKAPDGSTSSGRIDLYKRDCFVLEAKQGTDQTLQEELPLFGTLAPVKAKGTNVRGTDRWAMAMQRARAQAERYAKALPPEHGWPPFLIVVDVGHTIELFADFSLTGKSYTQFPDAQRYRIGLADLTKPDIRERLKTVWTEPQVLDPSRRSATVTRKVANHLAQLAKLLEHKGHHPESVAAFLMRCLFTMFAEDVKLLPDQCFRDMLAEIVERGEERRFKPQVESLWRAMRDGAFEARLGEELLEFDGGLFADPSAFALEREEIGVLLEAAKHEWTDVEPAIFGTLLERALDPEERHRLGAHFTPRAYVERLVVPTIVEPLREEWGAVQASALLLASQADRGAALREVRTFHQKLCEIRILDPACGTGNFLYVAMEHLKRLEGEVLVLAQDLGQDQYFLEMERHTVDPHQFLGIEVNPRAAKIAELVLWLGYLQWHFRTRGADFKPAEPVIRDFRNIECRDAILVWDRQELVRDERGKPVTRWDGKSFKKHPVTGQEVPDDTGRVELYSYIDPRGAAWPPADYIVGNPPFQGGKDLREVLGEGYTKALWSAHSSVPRSADLVMYWWDHAASCVREGTTTRFGLITTNSITQVFNRRAMERHLKASKPISLTFAIPDHPWANATGAANVRVAMTVGVRGSVEGRLQEIVTETAVPGDDTARLTLRTKLGKIASDLSVGVDVTTAVGLLANDFLCSPGVKLHGDGFIVTRKDAEYLGLGHDPAAGQLIFDYRNGRDLTARPRHVMVIDAFGWTPERLERDAPRVHQWLMDHVRSRRLGQAEKSPTADSHEYAERWWEFGKPRPVLRAALDGLPRYIVTVETAKHRWFQFLDANIRPDNKLICIGVSDAWLLSVLSSRIHICWALGQRVKLEDRPVYAKGQCFDPFPFPVCDDQTKARLRDLGERLDQHRKRQLDQYPGLEMTEMYNVLEQLRAGEPLDAKEKRIHEDGLVSVLLDLHRQIDKAVAAAYRWPDDLADEEILARLVELNRERAEEERQGIVRWLRPDFQASRAKVGKPVQQELDIPAGVVPTEPTVWPKSLPDQVQALRRLLEASQVPLDVRRACAAFKGARRERVEAVLQSLAALGQARRLSGDHYVA